MSRRGSPRRPRSTCTSLCPRCRSSSMARFWRRMWMPSTARYTSVYVYICVLVLVSSY
jgi:hypothetical protein